MSGDGVAAQPWPNVLFLPCYLHWRPASQKVDGDQLLLGAILHDEAGVPAKNQMTVQDGPFRLDRVFEKLATSDKVTLTVERLPEGKMRVTSNSW